MSLDSRLGLENGKKCVFSPKIDTHFKRKGFYESTMNPRFMNGYGYDNLTYGVPVLRLDFDDPKDDKGFIYITRLFINNTEVYMEKQNNYRGYETSDYYKFEEEPTTIEEIEKAILTVLN